MARMIAADTLREAIARPKKSDGDLVRNCRGAERALQKEEMEVHHSAWQHSNKVKSARTAWQHFFDELVNKVAKTLYYYAAAPGEGPKPRGLGKMGLPQLGLYHFTLAGLERSLVAAAGAKACKLFARPGSLAQACDKTCP